MTGQLEEEKMQVYVRLGIRLLYKVRVFFCCISCIPFLKLYLIGSEK